MVAADPPRVLSSAEVLPALRTAGACILEGAGSSREKAAALPEKIFGAVLAAAPEPAEVSEKTLGPRGIRKDDAFRAHTDGHAYGDLFPDYFLLLCAHASSKGGGNFVIDGYEILDGLAEDAENSWVVKALEERAVDQTSRLPSISPVVLRAPDGRRALRCRLSGPPAAFAAQRVRHDSDDPEKDARMLAIYHQAVEKAAEAADRIYLRPGDALVVDNYRMFHGRDPYVDPDRLLWRCWIWTTAARGVPDTELHSTPGNTAGEVRPDEAPFKKQRLEKAEESCKCVCVGQNQYGQCVYSGASSKALKLRMLHKPRPPRSNGGETCCGRGLRGASPSHLHGKPSRSDQYYKFGRRCAACTLDVTSVC